MPLIVTPRNLQHRAELYHQLSVLTKAGVGLIPALETVLRAPPAHSFRRPINQILSRLAGGATFAEALNTLDRWLPAFDVALIEACETSGRLAECFELLADYYRERSEMLRRFRSDLAYPAFVFHFALFLLPFPELFRTGDFLVYFRQTFGVLVLLYGAVFLLALACQGRHGESWRSLVERLTNLIPILGKARRQLALARLAAALEALINAGISIISAWELAASASGSPALKRAVSSWMPRLMQGVTPAEAVHSCPQFPALFASLYHTGEISGKLDDSLRRLQRHYQEEGSHNLHLIAEWTPRAAYLGIILMVAYKVIAFWTGYFGQLNDVMRF